MLVDGAAGKLEQSCLPIGIRHRIGSGDRDERRDGAPDLVDEDGEIVGRSSVAHPARSPIRSIAQAAVSASIGSSLSTHASASGRSSATPTLPSAVSAFRRSQRGSLRGT